MHYKCRKGSFIGTSSRSIVDKISVYSAPSLYSSLNGQWVSDTSEETQN